MKWRLQRPGDRCVYWWPEVDPVIGLTFALNLSMLVGKKAKIIVYDGRWFVDSQGQIKWKGEQQQNQRRTQVVTLQDHVVDQLPKYIQDGIFKNIKERVWPTSYSIPIEEVEDRLLDLVKPFVNLDWIELVPEKLNEQTEDLISGNFHLLVGADGAESFIRKYCNIQMISEGTAYSCAIAYTIPNPNDQPLHQAINCVLSSAQTRYLVHSSASSRHAHLNIRLNQEEYVELQGYIQQFKREQRTTIDLQNHEQCPHSPVWTIIREGLKFFNVPPQYVLRATAIQINVRLASVVVKELNYQTEEGRNCTNTHLAFLTGDAAMNVHFLLGYGMNSGMKEAMALARNISNSYKENAWDPNCLKFIDFIEFIGFMAKIMAREQQGRSLRVLTTNPMVEKFQIETDGSKYIESTQELTQMLQNTRDELQSNADWPHKNFKVSNDELCKAVKRVLYTAVAQLNLALPWVTKDWGKVEVLVEKTFPSDSLRYVTIPQQQSQRAITYRQQRSTVTENTTPYILWFRDGSETQFNSDLTSSSNSVHYVNTAAEVQNWFDQNSAEIEERNKQLKVISPWQDEKTTIALIDLIRRSRLPQTPILIYTNQQNEATVARRYFQNVIITDNPNEIHGFIQNSFSSEQWEYISLLTPTRLTAPPPPTHPKLQTQQPTSQRIVWVAHRTDHRRQILRESGADSTSNVLFLPTYDDLTRYLREDSEQPGGPTITSLKLICHGYFDSGPKNCIDILRLCDGYRFETSILVYTPDTDKFTSCIRKNYSDGNAQLRRLTITQKRADVVRFLARSTTQMRKSELFQSSSSASPSMTSTGPRRVDPSPSMSSQSPKQAQRSASIASTSPRQVDRHQSSTGPRRADRSPSMTSTRSRQVDRRPSSAGPWRADRSPSMTSTRLSRVAPSPSMSSQNPMQAQRSASVTSTSPRQVARRPSTTSPSRTDRSPSLTNTSPRQVDQRPSSAGPWRADRSPSMTSTSPRQVDRRPFVASISPMRINRSPYKSSAV
ncbi:unnamed protein product [Didymodactylos carnosus]|uniref:Uncharacterized protein n=1 Tax=Didymodactylos carnosus TaxID=1234261 RepID=A0A8S2HLB9_9BILA|nr:unnamed protein product [Didymodactylos carnosus]CAF3662473.1 unnamed protein product [Didymodactylos carnosus]